MYICLRMFSKHRLFMNTCIRTCLLCTEDTCTSMATARNIAFEEFLNEFAADDDSDFEFEGCT